MVNYIRKILSSNPGSLLYAHYQAVMIKSVWCGSLRHTKCTSRENSEARTLQMLMSSSSFGSKYFKISIATHLTYVLTKYILFNLQIFGW